MRLRARLEVWSIAVVGPAYAVVAGCGAAPPPASATASSSMSPAESGASKPPVAATASDVRDHTIPRASIRAIVAQGLGAFLRHLELDDHPALAQGRFHGFRIVALYDAAFWRGVDLRPGDVITGVNGLPIERPDQAQTAFDSLEVASELRVAFERDGQPRELVYSIVDGH